MKRHDCRFSRRLGMEALEGRQLMAVNIMGNVSASVVSGNLVVQGDANQNNIQISPVMQSGVPVAGKFYVAPLNGTQLNGQTSGQYFDHVTRNMNINLGGANDRLTLGTGGHDNDFVVPNSLNIDMGDGNNVVNINHIAVRNDATITTGSGGDSVTFKGTVGALPGIDSGNNDLTIKTGARADNVLLQNFFVRRNINIDTGTDGFSDFVTLNTGNVGNAGTTIINTAAGGDVVDIENVGFNKDLAIGTGSGADSVTIRNTSVDQLFAFLGTGQDVLTLDHVHGRNATLDGGTDSDSDTLDIIARDFTGVFSPQHFDHVFNS